MSKKKSEGEVSRFRIDVDIPKDMVCTARTVAALHLLGLHGVVYLQFDDSQESFDTRDQLKEIAGDCGFEFCATDERSAFLIDPTEVPEV